MAITRKENELVAAGISVATACGVNCLATLELHLAAAEAVGISQEFQKLWTVGFIRTAFPGWSGEMMHFPWRRKS